MRTRHFQAIKRTIKNQIISLENLASKQRIFQIVKEQHGFMLTVRSKDCSEAWPCGQVRTISTSHPRAVSF
jgi:hypothetical protein